MDVRRGIIEVGDPTPLSGCVSSPLVGTLIGPDFGSHLPVEVPQVVSYLHNVGSYTGQAASWVYAVTFISAMYIARSLLSAT